ncbi:E3 ubiquitin-protein ligase BIG BROTHER-like [Ipomoea triloba]|uniref:E3 ubiquitin-protein ligase BIG BROTHER-like n=1 Tax=Ipomoea triloba TaxID=35885 RepID=UPI00125D6A48|nr:E3 ubiquitin-protein ligase BIG BROTHER-like [Ipomoea triloba]XP_031100160.1 E3 ubiquitin-protein ligase BIG BROTHER-like [Ipomoea triloba]XP_031100161.1 E3 ubiquitin-protein ligase BIG BROTHER-like [Ipomoea triloba]XP_031100162.1 E3 ubiquitin-protein ligase BIG BROTHER-like [Ipomoea triloba]
MMSWNLQMEFQYTDTTLPYDSIGSFMDFFEGMAYDHLNYIFADVPYAQENSSVNTNLYKFGFSEPESFSYYDYSPGYSVTGQVCGNDGQDCHIGNSQTLADNDVVAANMHREDNSISTSHANSVECSRVYQNTCDNEVVWQDNIDPDNMTYEELLELGEAVGTQSRGLSQDLISLLPVTKFKCGLFSRKRSRKERCVICQMEYKRGDRQITLPCKHVYHTSCGSKWLSINKACPVCYTEVVVVDASKR